MAKTQAAEMRVKRGDSQITATFDIASNAVTGSYNVSVTTSGGASNTLAEVSSR